MILRHTQLKTLIYLETRAEMEKYFNVILNVIAKVIAMIDILGQLYRPQQGNIRLTFRLFVSSMA